jgi:hypothetical protein
MTTLSDIVNQCRQRYNAVGDKYFSDTELFDLVYDAEMELALATDGFENVYTASTVIGQREYDYPTSALKLDRVTYEGKRLISTNFIEDDAATGADEDTASTSAPNIYQIFKDRIYLRPVPSAVGTLKIYAAILPATLTAITDSLTAPERYRPMIKDFVMARMFSKDKNAGMTTYYDNRWQSGIKLAKQTEIKRKIGDQYPTVTPDELTAGYGVRGGYFGTGGNY